jgi:hypothetical protein
MRRNIKVIAGDEVMILKGALISGDLEDGIGSPTSMYIGKMDLDYIHRALYYANRTVLRILVDEFGIPLDKTDDFLVSAMSEALVKEYNNSVSGNSDLDYKRTRVSYMEEL